MFLFASKPSSWFSSSSMVRCTSESPPDPPSMRDDPIESISSMKMIDGACSLPRPHRPVPPSSARPATTSGVGARFARPPYRAITNSSRTMREPSPMYFCTSSLPETRIKVQSVWCATARARRVLPVPGGPYRSTPCERMPSYEHTDKGTVGWAGLGWAGAAGAASVVGRAGPGWAR